MIKPTDIIIGKNFFHQSLSLMIIPNKEMYSLADEFQLIDDVDGKVIKLKIDSVDRYYMFDSKIPREENPNYPYVTCREISEYDADIYGDIIAEVEM